MRASLKAISTGCRLPKLTHIDTCLCCDETTDTHGDDECEGEEDCPHGVSLFLRSRHGAQFHDAVQDLQAVESYFATLTPRRGHELVDTTRGAKARAI